ncbi:MAG TPA: chemotaxis protein CheW [Myxococcaceae bacterium]|nr:chemotaxis protein CheW [Myxococcaceae bacterium]
MGDDALSAFAEPSMEEIQEILDRRAERLKSRREENVEETLLGVAEFPIGEDRYAIPLESLRACLPLRLVTPVPLSAPHVVGVIRFQGQLISALSLSAMLDGKGWRQDPSVLLIVEPVPGHVVALDCEQIPRLISLPLQAVDRARARSGAEPVVELALKGQRPINMIDLKLLFERREGGERRAG